MFTRWVFWDCCQLQLPAKLKHFYLFDPCRSKILTVFFFSIPMKLYVIYGYMRQTILFPNRYYKRNLFLCFWQYWSNFWIWPKQSSDSRLSVQEWPSSNMKCWSLILYQEKKSHQTLCIFSAEETKVASGLILCVHAPLRFSTRKKKLFFLNFFFLFVQFCSEKTHSYLQNLNLVK